MSVSACLSHSPQVEGTSFHFDGSGFSLVQKSLRSTSTSVVLLFKTLSPGGLLLYLASNNTVWHTLFLFRLLLWRGQACDITSCLQQRDFLSLELVEGRVRLTFDLGSGVLILTTNRKYNTGVWYKITLQRNKRKGTTAMSASTTTTTTTVMLYYCYTVILHNNTALWYKIIVQKNKHKGMYVCPCT